MKLYHHPFSQPARTTRAVAIHLGIDCDEEVVDLMAGAQREPAYLAINPNGKVPALVDGDLKLWESTAIQLYLCEKAGDTDLWPATPEGRADVERWRAWSGGIWARTLATITFNRVFKKMFMGVDPDLEAVAAAEKEWRAQAAIVEACLDGRDWLCGDRVTLADLAVASMLTHWVRAEVPLKDFEKLHAWYLRVGELEAWKKTEPVWPS